MIGGRRGQGSSPDDARAFSGTALTLHQATGFWARLRGLHVLSSLSWGAGLHLSPCSAIHTFGLAYAIDVVFLDVAFQELKHIHALRPNRAAFCWQAVSVVELPAGYCAAYPDYAQAIRRTLEQQG